MKKYYEILIIIIAIIILLFITIYSYYNKEGFKEKDNYLDGIDVVYWINLNRSKDRYKDMTNMFKDEIFSNIPNMRIKAFDGKNDPQSVHDNLVIQERLVKKDTIYACLLSHLNAIKTFNSSNYDIALIMEDDVNLEFKKYWKKTVREIMNNAPNDWEIIMLSYTLGPGHVFNDWKNAVDYTDDLTSSTVSYIINKKGSSKIINRTYIDNKYVLDPKIPSHDSDGYIYLIAKTYAYKYPMFTYKSDNESTISDNHVDAALLSKNKIIEQYNK
jgi:GR25 family glycosyltransferase involved in LPS biosynthesis